MLVIAKGFIDMRILYPPRFSGGFLHPNWERYDLQVLKNEDLKWAKSSENPWRFAIAKCGFLMTER